MSRTARFGIPNAVAALLTLSVIVLAQVTAPSNATISRSAPKIAQPLPFQPGEMLTYEVSFSKLIFSGVVGDIKLSVAKAGDAKSNMLELQAEAVSRGFFPSLLGFKVKDIYSSRVNALDLGLYSFKRSIHEGKTRREITSVINFETGRVTYDERDPSNEKAEPKIKEEPTPSWVQDVLSALYYVRTQRLTEVDVITIPISDTGELYNVEVVVGSREELNQDLGKFKTVRLDAKVFDGRFIRRSGEMIVWMSDDPKRLIVRARIKTGGATVTAELKRISWGSDSRETRSR